MADTTDLLPPLRTVCDELTRNARERRRLRTLRRLILEAGDDQRQGQPDPRQEREARP